MMSPTVRSILFGFLATLLFAGKAEAQFTYDSLPISVVFYASDTSNIDSLIGGPDHLQARIGGIDFYATQFSFFNQVVTFEKGAIFHVYWTRASSDSCSALLTFLFHDPMTGQTYQSGTEFVVPEGGPQNVPQMTTIALPDSIAGRFNSIQIEVAGPAQGGTDGADSCFIDAIVLLQSGTYSSVSTPVASAQPALTNYPNPFYHRSGTHIAGAVPGSGQGTLLVHDAIGREIERIPLGAISGHAAANVSLDQAGIYFVQLLIDGSPVGVPLEISSQ